MVGNQMLMDFLRSFSTSILMLDGIPSSLRVFGVLIYIFLPLRFYICVEQASTHSLGRGVLGTIF